VKKSWFGNPNMIEKKCNACKIFAFYNRNATICKICGKKLILKKEVRKNAKGQKLQTDSRLNEEATNPSSSVFW